MKKHILTYSIVMLFTLLLGGCDKFERTGVSPEIYVNKSVISGFIGQEVQLTASPTAGKYAFQWSSENPAVASVSNTGLVKLLTAGSTVIQLSAGDIKQRVEVSSVLRIPVTEVNLSDSFIELTPLATKNVTVQILPVNANDVPSAIWSSENDKVASVSEKGVVTGVAEGSTSISYKLGDMLKKIKVQISYTRPFNGVKTLKAGPAIEIMAADFDFGGLGYAFNDDAANQTNSDAYRRGKGDANSYAVAIEGGGNNIGYMGTGFWYQYTVEVKDAGSYLLQLSLTGSAGNGKYHVEVDNVNATGSITFVSNNSWTNWTYHPAVPLKLNLTEGTHKIKFFAEQAAFNFKALRFTKE